MSRPFCLEVDLWLETSSGDYVKNKEISVAINDFYREGMKVEARSDEDCCTIIGIRRGRAILGSKIMTKQAGKRGFLAIFLVLFNFIPMMFFLRLMQSWTIRRLFLAS